MIVCVIIPETLLTEMDHNHNNVAGINSVNGSMEDLSLRQKQLPFRQQANKPLLKYSNSEPGPIYLYQNPDLKSGSNSSALPTAITSAPNSPAKVLPSKNKPVSSALASNQQSNGKQFTATPYNSYVPSVDPYARPLSAKDLMTIGIERTKSLNHLMNNTLAGSLANSMHATNMTNSSMFKPNKLESQQKPGTDVIPVSSLQQQHSTVSSAGSTHTATTKVVSIQPSTVTQTAKEKFEASLSKPPSGLERGTRPPSALRRPLSSTVRNPNYTPTKPYNEISGKEEEDFKMVSDSKSRTETKSKKNEDTLNNKISKAISSLSTRTKSQGAERQRHQLKQHSSSNESISDSSHSVSVRPVSAQLRTRDSSPAQSDSSSSGTKTVSESSSRTSHSSVSGSGSRSSGSEKSSESTRYYL